MSSARSVPPNTTVGARRASLRRASPAARHAPTASTAWHRQSACRRRALPDSCASQPSFAVPLSIVARRATQPRVRFLFHPPGEDDARLRPTARRPRRIVAVPRADAAGAAEGSSLDGHRDRFDELRDVRAAGEASSAAGTEAQVHFRNMFCAAVVAASASVGMR